MCIRDTGDPQRRQPGEALAALQITGPHRVEPEHPACRRQSGERTRPGVRSDGPARRGRCQECQAERQPQAGTHRRPSPRAARGAVRDLARQHPGQGGPGQGAHAEQHRGDGGEDGELGRGEAVDEEQGERVVARTDQHGGESEVQGSADRPLLLVLLRRGRGGSGGRHHRHPALPAPATSARTSYTRSAPTVLPGSLWTSGASRSSTPGRREPIRAYPCFTSSVESTR